MTGTTHNGGRMLYSVFLTSYGYSGTVADSKGIMRFYLPEKNNNDLVNRIKKKYPGIEDKENSIMKDARELLAGYFKGEVVDLKALPLNISGFKSFVKTADGPTKT